jgi:hypothetical protein
MSKKLGTKNILYMNYFSVQKAFYSKTSGSPSALSTAKYPTTSPGSKCYCSGSRRRAEKVDKRMVLVYTHGLFIT